MAAAAVNKMFAVTVQSLTGSGAIIYLKKKIIKTAQHRFNLARSSGKTVQHQNKALSVKVTPGKLTPDNKQRLEQEEKAEEKRLAIMMMKKKDKYLYDKIMFGKKRKVREANKMVAKRQAFEEASKSDRKKKKAKNQ